MKMKKYLTGKEKKTRLIILLSNGWIVSEWEVYNKRGKHLLVEDKDGNRVKGAVKGRRINV